MREHVVKVTNPSNGNSVIVHFTTMSYLDWAALNSAETRFDPPVMRYLIAKYVRKAEINGEEVDPMSIMDLPPTPVQTIIQALFDKAMFSNHDAMVQYLSRLDEQSRTLMGVYDIFLLVHGGLAQYLTLLEQDFYTRAHVINAIEQTVGFKVKDRFEESINTGIPLDIVSSPEQYQVNKNKHRKGQPYIRGARMRDRSVQTDDSFESLIEKARQDLAQRLAEDRARRNERRATFDFMRDEAEYRRFESMQDRALMDTPIQDFKKRPL